ncbi:MAG: hypothetical protein HC902_06635 [Calothrix sp. SM1_5_4]|nr:hypothetical protein [Calothrix sp. SM1_5_4]
MGDYDLFLQITAADANAPQDEIRIVQTRELERRTGVTGALRDWQILGSAGYSFLTSNRGETVGFLGLPRFDLNYNPHLWEMIPFFGFEKTLLGLGSNLEITEMRFGVNRRLPSFESVYGSLGYLGYSLSGTNPGSTRLGSLSAVSFGIGADQRFEDWLLRERFDFLVADSQSFALRLDAGKIRRWLGDEKLYIGVFANYSYYRADILNKINILESFTETRLQIGVTAGWIGADSLY